MNWKEEKAKHSYCGWCDGYLCYCDGRCFIESKENTKKQAEENKLDHLNLEIKTSEKRLKELKKELKNIKNARA